MKLYLKREVKVKARNILGKPVEVDEWYYIYKWTLRGRRYLDLFIPNLSGVVYEKLHETILPAKISFRWVKYKPTFRYTLEEANFIIQDIANNPNRYISST